MDTEHDLRLRAGMEAMSEWQRQHGAFTHEESAAARAEARAADAELITAMTRAVTSEGSGQGR